MHHVKTVDEEKSQSKARIAICWISLIAFSAVSYVRDIMGTELFARGLSTILLYMAFSYAWLVFVRSYPYRFLRRRYISVVADLGIMTIWLHLGGKYVGAYYPIFLWVIIGNGIRFGPRFLTWAQIIGAVGFGSVVAFSPYWLQHREVGIGMFLGVLVLPAFYQTLLRRLRRMQELEVALAKSRLADKAKDQFLATMSHEIRTPMNGVLGMAQALETTDLDDEQHEHLGIITRSVESLLHIINDILDYSKITSHGLTLESVRFDLRLLLEDVQSLLLSTADAKGLELEFRYPVDAPTGFLGDPTRIRQIVLNLVGNAIKFTEQGSVRLSCDVEPGNENAMVHLEIRDTGIGIPPERMSAVFDQFEQADNSTTRQYGGTGLGLAISRRLARMMKGDIAVDSVEGEGSTFTVTLAVPQCAVEVTEAVDNALTGDLPDYGLRALVAEDNPFNQVVARTMLERLGIEASIALHGARALEMLDEESFDLILMDVRMPVMNGYEATSRIRARDGADAGIPIVAVTADATRNDVRKCREAGMDLHVSKPLRLADIVTALDSLGLREKEPVG